MKPEQSTAELQLVDEFVLNSESVLTTRSQINEFLKRYPRYCDFCLLCNLCAIKYIHIFRFAFTHKKENMSGNNVTLIRLFLDVGI